jgi:hypothetical protein
MTEEEAKTKWCPAARHSYDESTGPGWNTGNSPLCQGSMCMAWRWKKRFGPDPDKPENITELPPTEGYCGLAGRPE